MAAGAHRRPTICLNMIVKDEAHVVTEALEGAADHIDRWVIVDTGSSDDTPRVIESFFADRGIPGELHRREWVNFGHNRTEALELVGRSADYAWVLDADDLVEGELDLGGLTADAYHVRFGPHCVFWRAQIFSTRRRWRYRGVVHEYPECVDAGDAPVTIERLEGDYHLVARTVGARNAVPGKYDRDCALLERAVEQDPSDARSRFYLAQSHRDAGRPEVAAEHYRIRMGMEGFEEERFVAAWRRAQSLERAGADPEVVDGAYLTAHQIRPWRAEPLCDLARFHRTRGEHALAYLAARPAAELPLPEDDLLFVDADVYRWRAVDEAAIAAYWCGRYEESMRYCDALLCSSSLPDGERDRIVANRDFAVAALPVDRRCAVIVPVLHRPQNVEPLMASLRASTGIATAYFVCDPDDAGEQDEVRRCGGRVLVHPGSFAQKANHGYAHTTEPWLCLVGDDVRFHPGWLDNALHAAGDRYHLVSTDDRLGFDRALAPHPVIRRSWIDEHGASWDGPGILCHEGYGHCFVDSEWTSVALQAGVYVYAPQAVIEHVHPLNPVSPVPDDAVYRQGRESYEADERLFLRRAASNMPDAAGSTIFGTSVAPAHDDG